MIYTTLNKIRAHGPCIDGWAKLLRYLGKTQADDESLPFATILDSNGFDDALWCLRAVDGHQREMRLYAVWCARQVEHLMADPRSRTALDVAERHATGVATDDELAAAWGAADAAWDAAVSAADDELAAARAAAGGAAKAARAAADAAARAAAWAAAEAEAAAVAAARAGARGDQKREFRRVFCGAVKA